MKAFEVGCGVTRPLTLAPGFVSRGGALPPAPSALLLALGMLSAGCSCALGATKEDKRASGQSELMSQTLAGQDTCDPKSHKRPFIIEWDGTDMSSFEQHAANDLVFVRYEGCELQVLDECRNESIRGEQGAYKPVEWTSGSLERIDIGSEAELYAKLPLAKVSLGARVAGGETFHMEYYVAGTRTATRDAVYENDLAGRYGCEDATHFVYGYNLGAFALASQARLQYETGGSAFGFGAGGRGERSYAADKKGGDLSVCKADDATEVQGCKAPIRLTLRGIRPGESPEDVAMGQPEDPASLSAAAVLNTKIEMSDEARARLEAAMRSMTARDGNNCLAELDAHDKLDPKHESSNPGSGFGMMRAQCLMLAGKCDAGKALMAKSYAQTAGTATLSPEQIDRTVEAMAGMYCEGALAPRDAFMRAQITLNRAYQGKMKVKECEDAYETVLRVKDEVKPKDAYDTQFEAKSIQAVLFATTPRCFEAAGECEKAFEVYATHYPPEALAKLTDPAQKEKILRDGFASMFRICGPKIAGGSDAPQ